MIYFVGGSTSITPSKNYQYATIQDVVAYCSSKKVLGVDTETTGLDFLTDDMIMFQIGDEENQYVIDTRHIDISLLRDILEDKGICKILHNAKFDYKFIKSKTGITMENCWDTMITEQVIHCGRFSFRFSLKALLDRYLNISMSKEVRNEFLGLGSKPFTDAQIIYGADDVKHLLALRDLQMKSILKHDLQEIVDLENSACLALSDIEYNGIGLDIDKWKEIAKQAKIDMINYQDKLDTHIETDPALSRFKAKYVQADLFTDDDDLRKVDVKWTSPKQVLEVFSTLIPGLENVNGKELLVHTKSHPLIAEYIKFKEISKLATSYGDIFLKNLKADNKIHTSFKQVLNTGRIASNSPNMQQIPADNKYRHCFIPDPGHVFVSADYSSQELCIIAVGSRDPVWIKALEDGEDLHSVCAELVYGQEWIDSAENDCAYMQDKSKCDCPKHKKLRTGVKTINFGLAYGMGPHKLADTLQISKEDAELLIKKYFNVFPSIKTFLEALGQYGKTRGHIKTFKPFKRIRWFEDWFPGIGNNRSDFKILGSIERASKNTPIQGTGADMTKLALVLIRNYINEHKLPVKMVMTVHDQIDTICPISYAETWAKELQTLMEQAAQEILGNELLKADPNITNQWEK